MVYVKKTLWASEFGGGGHLGCDASDSLLDFLLGEGQKTRVIRCGLLGHEKRREGKVGETRLPSIVYVNKDTIFSLFNNKLLLYTTQTSATLEKVWNLYVVASTFLTISHY